MATSAYAYKRIDLATDAIRLVRLCKGYFDEELRCELFEAFLSELEGIPYEALSYTWGGNIKSKDVILNGFKGSVTPNLHSALRGLRLKERDRILWADAICINQADVLERGHQVGQMRKIYQQADRVLIWLGESSDDIMHLMDTVDQLQAQVALKEWRWSMLSQRSEAMRELLGLAQHEFFAQQVQGLRDILQRPWFQRIWILQEVASARVATVHCGSFSAPSRIFTLLPWLLGVEPDAHCQAVLDIMPGISRQQSWWSSRRDLATLLRKFGGTAQASDSRDIVYALLGIASDTMDSDELRPDYTKGAQDLAIDTLSFLAFGSVPRRRTQPHLGSRLGMATRDIATFVELLRASDNVEDLAALTSGVSSCISPAPAP